jgi:hypothetical protein
MESLLKNELTLILTLALAVWLTEKIRESKDK